MQRFMKGISIITLILLIVTGTIAGCGSSNTAGSTSSAASNTAAATAAGSSSAGPASTSIVDSSKLTKLSVFAAMDPATAQSCKELNDCEVFKELEKRTGVHVDWIHPTDVDQQFNLMVASGKYPDLIKYNWKGVKGGAAKYAQDGVILKLNDLIKNYAAGLNSVISKYPIVSKEMTDALGDMYYLPELIVTPENNIYKGPVIRKDWLEKLNLSVPADVNQLYEVLKAFKEKDPNGNGKADEWGMSGACNLTGGGFMTTSAHSIGHLSWAWDTNTGFYLKDGKVKYGPMEPEFGDALKYTNKLYAEGLLDPDYIVNDRSKLDAKVMNDQVGFCFHYQPTNFMTQMAGKEPNFNIAGIPYLKGPGGQKGDYDGSLIQTVVNDGCMAITTACKYPEEAMKWLDYCYSEEGNLLFNFGIENKSYTMQNGVPTYTDLILHNPDGLTSSVALGKWSMSVCKWSIIQDVNYFRQYVVTDYSRDSIKAWIDSVDFDPFEKILPVVEKSPEDTETYTAIMADIETYVAEMTDKFVLGKESFNNYDNFVQTLKNMKIEEAIALQQTGYDKYESK